MSVGTDESDLDCERQSRQIQENGKLNPASITFYATQERSKCVGDLNRVWAPVGLCCPNTEVKHNLMESSKVTCCSLTWLIVIRWNISGVVLMYLLRLVAGSKRIYELELSCHVRWCSPLRFLRQDRISLPFISCTLRFYLMSNVIHAFVFTILFLHQCFMNDHPFYWWQPLDQYIYAIYFGMSAPRYFYYLKDPRTIV